MWKYIVHEQILLLLLLIGKVFPWRTGGLWTFVWRIIRVKALEKEQFRVLLITLLETIWLWCMSCHEKINVCCWIMRIKLRYVNLTYGYVYVIMGQLYRVKMCDFSRYTYIFECFVGFE